MIHFRVSSFNFLMNSTVLFLLATSIDIAAPCTLTSSPAFFLPLSMPGLRLQSVICDTSNLRMRNHLVVERREQPEVTQYVQIK